VFERFTDRARRVLVLAQEEARLLNHSFIGTEHILLGLLAEGEGVAAKALGSLGVTLVDARQKTEEAIGMSGGPPSGSPPFTPRAKKVMELALREALQLNHTYIGTEHLLLGLVREGEGVATAVMVSLGADLGSVRQRVIQLMSGAESEEMNEGIFNPQMTQFGGESQTQRGPLCPQCRASLADEARHRVLAVPADGDSEDVFSVQAVYCGRCGATIQMFKTEE
jgi:ATP-dependent Clp protease ATP-binding subunit ClpC